MKPKKVNFELIEPFDGNNSTEPYMVLAEARKRFHDDLRDANIALAWQLRLKPDDDGHLVLGRCVKMSDLYREFADYHFVIVLNREVWNDIEFTAEKKLALMDHELCHAAPDCDEESGEQKRDERGRPCYRVRKHDIEEFGSVVAHHGTYKRDLERFAEVLLKRRKAPLFETRDANSASAELQ